MTPLQCCQQEIRLHIFLFTGGNLTINAVFLKAFRLGLKFFQVSLALDTESGKRHYFQSSQRNLFFAILADSVLSVVKTCQRLIDIADFLTLTVAEQEEQFPVAFV